MQNNVPVSGSERFYFMYIAYQYSMALSPPRVAFFVNLEKYKMTKQKTLIKRNSPIYPTMMVMLTKTLVVVLVYYI